MCGFVALFSPRPPAPGTGGPLGRTARTMAAAARHRGPDGEGLACFAGTTAVGGDDRAATIALAHHRLAILDLSPRALQPMLDASGRYCIVYNGEIYNFLELRAELEGSGARLESTSDTEVLVELFRRQGPACLARLEGMFAFVVVDLAEGRAHAARDRFGIKPLYYWTSPEGCLAFASEIKQLTLHPSWRPELNGQRAHDYLARGLIDHDDETLFSGVRQLPAGGRAEIELRARPPAARIERWYSIAAAADPGDASSGAERLRQALDRSVRRHLRSDVPVGSCLSGGLDSSAIVALVGESRRGESAASEFLTFTARHPDPKLDEGPLARRMALAAGARSIDVRLDGRGLLGRLQDIVWMHDEPIASASVFAQHRVFAAAAEHGVKVMLDGQGADEQLGGYHTFFKVVLLELLRAGRVAQLRDWIRSLRRDHGYSVAAIARKMLAAWVPARSGSRWASRLRRWRRDAVCFDHRRLGADPRDPILALDGRRRGVREFSLDEIRSSSLPALLHWEDRNSMAHSVEARVPFLDHTVVELALGLPTAAKLDRGVTKKVLRDAMAGLVPDEIRLRRDKIAFAAPEAEWLTRDFKAEAAPALRDACEAMNGVAGADARRKLEAILDGRLPYDGVLWRVICFGAWLARFGVRA